MASPRRDRPERAGEAIPTATPSSTRKPTLVVLPQERSDRDLAGQLVAVLFVAAGPVAWTDLVAALDVSAGRLEEVLDAVVRAPPPGLSVLRLGPAVQLATAPSAAAAVERYQGTPPPARLSRAALEALAIVAYRQPVTRGEIDLVRGVNSDSAVSSLLARGLVAEVGRRETVGRPVLLATTAECLGYLGISSLAELPTLPDVATDGRGRQ